MTGYFIQAFIYLIAAIIAVPIAKRFGLGSVLGYLVAGVVIGPMIGLVGEETATIQHFAEFGVVMMLFLVGLELEPKMLWHMRNRLLGLGGLQVAGTTLAVTLLAIKVFDQSFNVALTIGLIFALSSTAIVLQTLDEKQLSKTDGGRSAFSVLLFQDIAVIPMLALIPLLAVPELMDAAAQSGAGQGGDTHSDISLANHLSGWPYGLVMAGAVALVIAGGHYFCHPLFKFVAKSGLREIFTATALMLIIGISALMGLVGLSPALGAFLAGVVLANSEFRHELESTIEPFKGLLLGLFFITVGAGIQFNLLFDNFFSVIGLTLGIMAIKFTILLLLGFSFRIRGSDRWLFSLSLAQAGEFGFVLLNFGAQNHVLDHATVQLLSLVVALSMVFTPALFIAFDRYILPRFEHKKNDPETDEITEQGTVIIAGIGRFGQIINRLLVANGVHTVVLDHEITQVENVRRFDMKGYFGDASRLDLLHTAGIDNAACIVIAIDDKIRSVEITQTVKRHHPNVKVMARAFDRGHLYQLRQAGADHIIAETYHSALELGGQVLMGLGFNKRHADIVKAAFVDIEKRHQDELYEAWQSLTEDIKFSSQYSKLFITLEQVMGEEMKKTCEHLTDYTGSNPAHGHADEAQKPQSEGSAS
ncbi:MAG: monovalent cation:proton antiporter-2 (CPA2) family protein [Pseudomonadales bacterium]|nr:monovalent cation:proton antiporter-2 (CPA2) family protein [Pseudomonadales bacterium]